MHLPPLTEIGTGLRNGALIAAAVLVFVLPLTRPPGGAEPAQTVTPAQVAEPARNAAPIRRQLDFAGTPASAAVRNVAAWVVASADNGERPFVILDKKNARVFAFDAGGRLTGASPVLLGYAIGDDAVEGIGERPIEQVRPQERTTPAGRFVSEPGRNGLNEDVVWVDYGLAVSMHRVRLSNPAERRLERLASPRAADRRISYGCINVPPAFFEEVLWPVFGSGRGIVYVLPEVKALAEVFPGMRTAAPARAPGTA